MQNWLLVGRKKSDLEKEIASIAKTNLVLDANIFRFNSLPEEFNVEIFREMLKLTERHFAQPTIFVVENLETFSQIIQNTFLKTLEEHQDNLCFLLLTRNLAKILPTVRSRCRILKLQNQAELLEKSDRELFEKILRKLEENPQYLVSLGAGLGIKNKKEKGLIFLEKFLLFVQSELIRAKNKTTLARYARRAIEMRDLIENNNLDPELALDQVFLS